MNIIDCMGYVVNFETNAPSVLGNNRRNVKIQSILDFSTASILADVRARHSQVKAHIQDLPELASAYMYAKVQYSNGDTEILGIPWIKQNTIEVVSDLKLMVTINNVTERTKNIVTEALLQNGIDFTIEEVGTRVQPQ